MLHPTHRRLLLLLLLIAGVCAPGLLAVPPAAAFRSGQAASLVLGQRSFTASVYATADHLANPQGVAVDPTSGAVFVADSEAHRVLRFGALASLTNGAAAEGVLGQPDLLDATAGTSARSMNRPTDLALDRNGTLWVVDAGNGRVLRFDAAASKPNGAPADGVLGQSDFTGRVEATSAQGMRQPGGVAVDDSGRLWVADSGNNRVLRFDAAASKPNGAPADGVLGQRDFTSGAAAVTAQGMTYPYHLTVDVGGRLWVADAGADRVLRFDAAAGKPNGAPADGVLGQADFTSTLGPVDARILTPMGIVADVSGRLWVGQDFGGVLQFDAAASKPNGAAPDGLLGPPAYAPLATSTASVEDLALDRDGRLWVADSRNNRVLRFDAAASKPNSAPADGVLGHSVFTRERSLSAVSGFFLDVAVDPITGKVFVADALNNRVLRFAARAALSNGAAAEAVLGQPDFTSTGIQVMNRPVSLALDQDERLWVADQVNNRVLRFDDAATKPSGAPADGVLGNVGGSPATTAGGMRSPWGVAIGPDGTLWVADRFNSRVLRFDAPAAKPNGAPADGVLGQRDFTSRAQATTAQGLSWPTGVAVEPNGTLWVADRGNNRVLRFDAAASKPNGAPADGVLGQDDFTSRAVATTARRMGGPADLTTDSRGRLWVADTANSRVLRFDLAASKPNGAPADGVLGQRDFASSNRATTASGMVLPQGLALDRDGSLWVADSSGDLSDDRVLLFDDLAPTQAVVRAAHATSQRPLPNTAVQASGLSRFGCRTDPSGACVLADLPPGAYTLALTKTDDVAGITAYDAALILQHAQHQRTLSGPAFTAGDTSGDGQVSATDADLVLRYAASLRSLPFPAGKVWTFTAPPLQALDQDQQVTVAGVLIGDVSGHLAPAALGLRGAETPAAGALQMVRRGKPDAGGFQTVELWLSPGATPLWSLAATLRLDPALLGQLQISARPPRGGLTVVQATPDGQIHLALASAEPLASGAVVSLRYRASAAGDVGVEWAETNEGGVPEVLPAVVQDWRLHVPLVQRGP